MDKTIRYIIGFLLGKEEDENTDWHAWVGYTDKKKEFANYKVVIIPSNFFADNIYGNKKSRARYPFDYLGTTPILFGSKLIEKVKDTIVVHADIIASSFYLLSRYEETVRLKRRDEHGRFIGKKSLAYKAGFLNRPIVDEYGQLLREWLQDAGVALSDPPKGIQKIYLTHDVDAPFFNRSWRNVVRQLTKGDMPQKLIKEKFGKLTDDKYYTFPWIFETNQSLVDRLGADRVETILFFKGGGLDKFDKPVYDLKSKDMAHLFALCKDYNVRIGLHTSYQAGGNLALILEEKSRLEDAIGEEVTINRNHYLASRAPEDFHRLIKAGIKEDFTMGYADAAGFRLGTSRAVRWIDPAIKNVSSLVLHPLLIMDCTLSVEKYMNLSHEEAKRYAECLLEAVEANGGEAVLLWHNTAFSALDTTYNKALYTEILTKLSSK